MPADPSKAEILGYRARTGATVTEIVDHFWAGRDDGIRGKAFERVKKMVQRDREPGQPSSNRAPAPPTDSSTVDGPPRPEADYETARLERVAFLEWHLAELLADLAWVRSAGMVGRIAPLSSQVLEVRQQLDTARGQGKPVALDRNPAAVAEEVERRDKRIRQLAATTKERDL